MSYLVRGVRMGGDAESVNFYKNDLYANIGYNGMKEDLGFLFLDVEMYRVCWKRGELVILKSATFIGKDGTERNTPDVRRWVKETVHE